MEDQPTDSGDLTTDAEAPSNPQGKTARNRHRLPRQLAQPVPSADAEPTESSDDVEPVVPEEPKTPEAEPAAEADLEVASDQPAPILVAHRPANRALKIAAVAAGVLFVGSAAFAGAAAQPYLADRALVAEKFEVAETAASAISTLWTYAPDNIDKLPDRAAKFLTGDFAAQYRQFIDSIVEPNKQAQVTNETHVVGAAVESITPTEASAIVYTNSVATSPVTKGVPSLRYLSYRLTMVPRDGQWLINKMSAVTSLDLSPKV